MSWTNLTALFFRTGEERGRFPKFPGTWRRTVWYKYSVVLEELTVSFFRRDEERGGFSQISWDV